MLSVRFRFSSFLHPSVDVERQTHLDPDAPQNKGAKVDYYFPPRQQQLFQQGVHAVQLVPVTRQPLGVLDVVGRLPDPALRVLDGIAEAVVEAQPVERDLSAVVTSLQARGPDRFIQGRQYPEPVSRLRRPLRFPPRSWPG